MKNENKISLAKYIYAFVVTLLIFSTTLFVGNYFNSKKIDEVKNIESKIAIDILASETQFNLLTELACDSIKESSFSQELGSLDERLKYMESHFDTNDEEFINLKKYYSVLEIKDFLLFKKFSLRCPQAPTSILYFYSNTCPSCESQGFVLTQLRQTYPQLRVYSFDLDLDLPVIKTLASIYKIETDLPALVIKEKTTTGFQSLESFNDLFQKYKIDTKL